MFGNISSTHCMINIISIFIIMQASKNLASAISHQNMQAIMFQICKIVRQHVLLHNILQHFRTCKLAVLRCSKSISCFLKYASCKLSNFTSFAMCKFSMFNILRQQLFASLQTTSQQFLRYASFTTYKLANLKICKLAYLLFFVMCKIVYFCIFLRFQASNSW